MHKLLGASPTTRRNTTNHTQTSVSISHGRWDQCSLHSSFLCLFLLLFFSVLHLKLTESSEGEKHTHLHLSFLVRFCWLCCLSSRIFQAFFATAQEHFHHIQRVQLARIRLEKQDQKGKCINSVWTGLIFSLTFTSKLVSVAFKAVLLMAKHRKE